MICALLIFGNSAHWTLLEAAVGLACVAILFAFGFAGERITPALQRQGPAVRLSLPLLFALPYLLIAGADGVFRWRWLAVYVAVPVSVGLLLWLAARIDPEQRGTWCDYVVLLLLGLAVDLRWLEPAWPAHLHSLGKIVLLDTGLYGFLGIRGLTNTGIDFRVRWQDVKIGLRELVFYAPFAIPLGLALGFLHVHRVAIPWWIALAWLYTVVFIAIPEEIFFRGWMQNLLERRLGRMAALTHDLDFVRAFALQQTGVALQLAVRGTGDDCRDFLRTCLARGETRGGVGHYPRVGGHAVVDLAALKTMGVGVITQVAESDAHVVVQGGWNGDGNGETEDGVGETQRVEIAVTQEQGAGGNSPDERCNHEHWVGNMGAGEEAGGDQDRQRRCAEDAEQAQQKIFLQNELLQEGPEDVAPDAVMDHAIFIGRMERLLMARQQDLERGEDEGQRNHPEGAFESADTELQGAAVLPYEES